MLAYAEYFNDARIKSYVEGLKSNNIKTYLYCLNDKTSKTEENNLLKIIFLQNKYQGKNSLFYIFSYIIFFIRAFYNISFDFFKYRFDVIHVHNIPDFLVFSALVPKLNGKKIILDMHDVMTETYATKFSGAFSHFIRWLVLLQSKLSLLFSDILICVNKSQLRFMKNEGIKKKQTKVFMNLPNKLFFKRRLKLPVNDAFHLIYHGTITERLGIDLIIKAVEIASKSVKIKLTLIGDGELKADMIKYCTDNNLYNEIIFFNPFLVVNQLQSEIEKNDAGIIGNRKSVLTDEIMLPVKLMEYLAVGLPVLAPDLKIIKEHFKDNMIVYYIVDNVNDLAQKIIYLYENKDTWADYVRNSDSFLEKHNWEKQEREYIDLIKNLA